MMQPTYDYDHGRVTLVFPASGEAFATSTAAERWLEARGFSVGRRQASEPRGILFGTFSIRKWRDLRPLERGALHGQVTGDVRRGPVVVTLFDTAPTEAIAAFRSPIPTRDVATEAFVRSADIAAVAALIFVIGSIVFVSVAMPKRQRIGEIVVGKSLARAGVIGLRAAAHPRLAEKR